MADHPTRIRPRALTQRETHFAGSEDADLADRGAARVPSPSVRVKCSSLGTAGALRAAIPQPTTRELRILRSRECRETPRARRRAAELATHRVSPSLKRYFPSTAFCVGMRVPQV